ncbi:uncharacterized protein TNCV_2622441 [Trichonephila clavipes]|uniref:Uncharacterized protein n=1 Tax=Trichonephila clavipes TaxID=2585209 RepID=A0A8X6WBU9_TRICX|nr:uncharacterized protein TNCV_2622441 [Trichonephila clavipes]
MREYRAWRKTLQNTLLMPSLRDGNAIETLLMTAQINTDFVNHPVPSTTEPSTSLVHVGTDAYDLRMPVAEQKNILLRINLEDIKECYNYQQSLSRKSIPNLSKYNSFVYLEIPAYFPTLDLVSERLNSP